MYSQFLPSQIFDNAMELVTKKYWEDVTFNGAAITSSFISCTNAEKPYNDYKAMHNVGIIITSNMFRYVPMYKFTYRYT